MRATEATGLRLKDVDFNVSPIRITIRKETTKTKRGRAIYCSDEATKQLHILIESHRTKKPEDYLFAIRSNTKSPRSIYMGLLEQFERLQHKLIKIKGRKTVREGR